jgi:predicted phosphodiesterase
MTRTPLDRLEGSNYQYPWKFNAKDQSRDSTRLALEVNRASETVRFGSEEDPFGKVDKLQLFCLSDTHLPRKEPEREPTVAIPVWRAGGRILGKLFGRDNPNWYQGERQNRFVASFVGAFETLRQRLELKNMSSDDNSLALVVHLGDRGADAEGRADMENAFVMTAEAVMGQRGMSDSESVKTPKVRAVFLPGDHEYDVKRHGDEPWILEQKLTGDVPGFFQRVGGDKLVVGMTTSLWMQEGDIGKDNMRQWARQQEELRRIISKAAEVAHSEGRSVVMMGHKETALRMCAEEFDLPVRVFVAGHQHVGGIRRKKDGVISANPGAPTFGAMGVEVDKNPSMVEVRVGGGDDPQVDSVSWDPSLYEQLM